MQLTFRIGKIFVTPQDIFSESLTRNFFSKLTALVQQLVLHELFNIYWEMKHLGGACFVHVPANVPYTFISESL
jgi:hypothetical protein